jgi:carbon starvation protein
VVPLVWLLAVTMTAGWMKIFSADPRLGFLRMASDLRAKIAGGASDAQILAWHQQLTNNYINAAVTGAFMVLVLLVVGVCARAWWCLLVKRQLPALREEPYVALELVTGK